MTNPAGELSLKEVRLAFESQQWERACHGFLSFIRAYPNYHQARFRVADALLNLGHRKLAARVYRELAWLHLRGGQPLLGLAAAKMMVALEPAEEGVLSVLAELYSAESDRVRADLELMAPEVLAPETRVSLAHVQADTLFDLAASEASLIQDPSLPPHLPPLPLFSFLSSEDFDNILGSVGLRRFARGDVILRRGEMGEKVFMLAEGSVQVERGSAVLARLPSGAVFGEMALISNAPRVATVRASEECSALELSRVELENRANPSIREALTRFTRSRLLANLAATSPLFTSLPRTERFGLMAHFKPKRTFAEDILIEEGEPGRGLFVVASGYVEVSRERNILARLGPGQVVGEMSLIHDIPTTATVRVIEPGEVLVLVPRVFQKVMKIYPDVARMLAGLSAERLGQALEPSTSKDGAFLV